MLFNDYRKESILNPSQYSSTDIFEINLLENTPTGLHHQAYGECVEFLAWWNELDAETHHSFIQRGLKPLFWMSDCDY